MRHRSMRPRAVATGRENTAGFRNLKYRTSSHPAAMGSTLTTLRPGRATVLLEA
jgi:hypothetical protein